MRISELLRQPPKPPVSGTRAILDSTFEYEPVSLDVFVQDRAYMGNPKLSLPQYNAVRSVEQIFYPELYPLMVEEFGDYWKPVRFTNLITLMWGKGGGKDHTCRIMVLRCAYLLLCLHSPQNYFAMPPQDTIHMLNVASSSGQAQRAFFTPMVRAVKRGWFASRVEPKQSSIAFSKNVEAISGHSDAESQEGSNLIIGIADEIDAFRSKEEMQFRAKQQREPTNSAEAILEMMQTSASTRFPRTYKNVRISYPRYLGSKIMQLLDEADKDIAANPDTSRHYASGPLATWEVNPRVKGKDDFKEDYDKQPLVAAAKYECLPSPAINPFMRNEDSIAAIFRAVDVDPVTVAYEVDWRQIGDKRVARWNVNHSFSRDLVPITGARYALHADIGIKRDFMGVALAHVTHWRDWERIGLTPEEAEVQMLEPVPFIKVDFCFSYEHDMGAKPIAREIQIRWVRSLYEDLRALGFDIPRVSFDSYQSTESLQFFRDLGVETEVVSTDRSPDLYDGLRDHIYDQRIEAPYNARCLRELSSLQKLPNGKIDHPPYGSKDEADALCAAVFGAVSLGGAESETREVAHPGDDTIEVFDYVDMPLDMASGRLL